MKYCLIGLNFTPRKEKKMLAKKGLKPETWDDKKRHHQETTLLGEKTMVFWAFLLLLFFN